MKKNEKIRYKARSFRLNDEVYYWMKVMRARKGAISWNKLFFNFLLDDGDKRNISQKIYGELKKDYCEECGVKKPDEMSKEEYWKKPNRLEVHHIDGDFLNNKEDNLKTLCIVCHKKKHRKK